MVKKVTVRTLLRKKERGEKITMVSTYDYLTAKFCEEVGIDAVLVGDSLGMVFKGEENTLGVTLEEIVYHSKAVRRGAPTRFVIADMPFGSYQISVERAVENAVRVIKETGVDAVKLEGGEEVVPIVKRLAEAGVAVVGHLGFTPQKVKVFGGAKVVGREEQERDRVLKEAALLEAAGAVMLVLEAVPSDLTKEVSEKLDIPVIGIGAGPYADGQVLVFHDLVGLVEEIKPKFVKRYLQGAKLFKEALRAYKEEVEKGLFPSEEHSYDG
ncbi:MAG: 3-methyl-2-oxobutanoate hydroxymethyltransferase [Aquificae bacterium]|nr:3-methyl-2-oxobutanoate hydroxymethyltransferase [Aquificota bacterium]